MVVSWDFWLPSTVLVTGRGPPYHTQTLPVSGGLRKALQPIWCLAVRERCALDGSKKGWSKGTAHQWGVKKAPGFNPLLFRAPFFYRGPTTTRFPYPHLLTAWCCCFSVAVFGVFSCFGCHWTTKKSPQRSQFFQQRKVMWVVVYLDVPGSS